MYYCAACCSEKECNHAKNCGRSGYEPCWDSHVPRRGAQRHEKVDTFCDYLAKLVLHSETDNEAQAKLHERDRKAEWFTVNSGSLEDSEPTVQITDRFRKLCDPKYVSNRSHSEQHPSIVSFIGTTLPGIKDTGKQGEELYYARFLYAFSDVIVFVTNNDQQLHKDLQNLLERAASAVHKAINHLPRKTLIVVQNMPARHNPDYYTESFHKQSLFESLTNIWDKSKILSAFKKRHDKQSIVREGEIDTNEKFLNIFFQSLEACYVPNKGFATSAKVMEQYRVLRRQIVQAVEVGQRARSNSWTRYDVSSLSHLFGHAFHHFTKLLGPFDFYTAARKDNPMSVTMDDHIANLLRYMQASDRQLESFHSVVAVCLITFAYRDFRQGSLGPCNHTLVQVLT